MVVSAKEQLAVLDFLKAHNLSEASEGNPPNTTQNTTVVIKFSVKLLPDRPCFFQLAHMCAVVTRHCFALLHCV